MEIGTTRRHRLGDEGSAPVVSVARAWFKIQVDTDAGTEVTDAFLATEATARSLGMAVVALAAEKTKGAKVAILMWADGVWTEVLSGFSASKKKRK